MWVYLPLKYQLFLSNKLQALNVILTSESWLLNHFSFHTVHNVKYQPEFIYPTLMTCRIRYNLTHIPPSAAYVRRWTGCALVQVMACRLFGAKPLPEPMLGLIVNLSFRDELQWNVNRNRKTFNPENALENVVCEVVAIVSRRRWVETSNGIQLACIQICMHSDIRTVPYLTHCLLGGMIVMKLILGECHRTSWLISQYWFW